MKCFLILFGLLTLSWSAHAQTHTIITPENAHQLTLLSTDEDLNSGQIDSEPYWSPNGDQVAYGGFPNAWLFDGNDLSRPPRRLETDFPVNDIAWSPDGGMIALGGYQGLRVVTLASLEIRSLPGQSPMTFNADGRLFVSVDGDMVVIYETHTWTEVRRLHAYHHLSRYTRLVFHPDGTRLYALYHETGGSCMFGYSYDLALAWDIARWYAQPVPNDPLLEIMDYQTDLIFAGDPSLALMLGGRAVVADAATLAQVWEVEIAYAGYGDLSADAERVAYNDAAGYTQVVLLPTGEPVVTINAVGHLAFRPGHQDLAIRDLIWSAAADGLTQVRLDEVVLDGERIVTLTRDNILRVTSVLTGATVSEVVLPLNLTRLDHVYLTSTSLLTVGLPVEGTPNGAQVARLWDLQSGTLLREVSGRVQSVNINETGSLLILGSSRADTIAILDTLTGEDVPAEQLSPEVSPRFLPDGRLVYGSDADHGRLAIYDPVQATTQRLADFADLSQGILISPDRRYLLSPETNGHVINVWDTQTNQPLPVIPNLRARDNHYVFAPDAPLLAFLRDEDDRDEFVVWDLAAGRIEAQLVSEKGRYKSISDLRGDVLLLTDLNDCDEQTETWNYRTGEHDVPLPNRSPFYSAVSPDGRIGIVNGNQRIMLYDTATHAELLGLDHGGANVERIFFVSDGRLLATQTSDSTVWTWGIP